MRQDTVVAVSVAALAEALHDVRCMAADCRPDELPRVRTCVEWQTGRYKAEACELAHRLPARPILAAASRSDRGRDLGAGPVAAPFPNGRASRPLAA